MELNDLPKVATNIAIIDKDNSNIVTNIIWGYIYDTSFIKENEDIIQIDDLAVAIGDIYDYEENCFYHNGEKVKSKYERMETELVEKDEELDEMLQVLIDDDSEVI